MGSPVPITCQIWWWSSQSLSGETSSRAPCPPGWPRWSSVGRAPGWGKEGPHTALSRLEGEMRGWQTDRRGTDPWGQGSLCHNKPLKNCYYSSKDFCYLVGSEVGSLFQQVWFSMVGPFVRICVLYQLNLNSMLQNPHWQAATTPVLVWSGLHKTLYQQNTMKAQRTGKILRAPVGNQGKWQVGGSRGEKSPQKTKMR